MVVSHFWLLGVELKTGGAANALSQEAEPPLISYWPSLSSRARARSGVIEDLLAPSHCVFSIVTWNSFLCIPLRLWRITVLCSLISCSLGPTCCWVCFQYMQELCLLPVSAPLPFPA